MSTAPVPSPSTTSTPSTSTPSSPSTPSAPGTGSAMSASPAPSAVPAVAPASGRSSTSRLLSRSRYEGHPRAVDIAGESSPWSTPFPPSRSSKVADTYTMFEAWVRRSPDARARWIRSHIGDLVGKDIMCDCTLEEFCHGNILLEMIEEAAAEVKKAAGSTDVAPAGWVRVRLPATDGTDGLVCFGIEVSDYSRHGRVTNAATIARWMIGHTCADIARWIRERGGTAVRMDRIHAHLEQARRHQDANQPHHQPHDSSHGPAHDQTHHQAHGQSDNRVYSQGESR